MAELEQRLDRVQVELNAIVIDAPPTEDGRPAVLVERVREAKPWLDRAFEWLAIAPADVTAQDRDFIAEGRLMEASGETLARRYTPEKIKQLDELGDLRKTGGETTPDVSSPSESLRTVGRMVDSKRGRLIKLTKEPNKITFVYEDENGQAHKEELYGLSIYKGQQEALTERGSKAANVWDEALKDRSPQNPNLKLKS